MAAKPPAARGAAAEGHVDRLLSACAVIERGRFCWHQHHPPIRGGTRGESGLPDREVVWHGRAYMLEVKEETGTSAALGCLSRPDDGKRPAHGVTWQQAEEMDRATLAGVPCFVVMVLTVPAKAAKRRKDGTVSDSGQTAATIARIVPWPAWRALMQTAEDQRAAVAQWQRDSGRAMVAHGPTCPLPPKPTVDASIPAADLATMGHPCRNATELLKALGQPC